MAHTSLLNRLARMVDRLRGPGSGAPPVTAVDARWSVVSSLVDQEPAPDRLVEILLGAAEHARGASLAGLRDRGLTEEQARWLACWPGEHYRLLTGLAATTKPRLVVEIGTWTGLGSLSLLDALPAESRLVTYDVVPWRDVPGTALTADDFAGGRLEQRLGDLSDPGFFAHEVDLLREADLIFCDAPKDGRFEPAFLALALPALADRPRLLVFDDIRLLPMVQLWRDLPLPKLDVTSLGHWSGTGLALTA